MKKKILENIKTVLYALIIALLIRSFLFQPFYIPSSSMEPSLQVGDRLFVSKYTYGYSKHSFPFSPNIFSNRLLGKKPQQGDVIVFKTPSDNRTDYVKRLIKAKKLVREPGWLYYIDKQGDISRSRMKKYHETGKAKREKVLKLGIVRKPELLYYLDKDLNVQTSPMKRGKK